MSKTTLFFLALGLGVIGGACWAAKRLGQSIAALQAGNMNLADGVGR